jgi:hypothetical protein
VKRLGFRRRYGDSPPHLLLLLCSFALTAYAGVRLLRGDWLGIALWFAGAALLHDLVLLPLYSSADRAARVAARGAVNYVRVPAGVSLLMLLVFWGTIGGKGERTYHAVSGRSYEGYALRWLLVTAALFAGSGLIYLVRRASRS